MKRVLSVSRFILRCYGQNLVTINGDEGGDEGGDDGGNGSFGKNRFLPSSLRRNLLHHLHLRPSETDIVPPHRLPP